MKTAFRIATKADVGCGVLPAVVTILSSGRELPRELVWTMASACSEGRIWAEIEAEAPEADALEEQIRQIPGVMGIRRQRSGGEWGPFFTASEPPDSASPSHCSAGEPPGARFTD